MQRLTDPNPLSCAIDFRAPSGRTSSLPLLSAPPSASISTEQNG